MRKSKNDLEFVILMAMLMANVALSIDSILPALDIISNSFNTSNTFRSGDIVTFIFLGLGIGELFFGMASDFVGRKPAIYLGVSIFVVSSCLCLFTSNITIFLLGRVIQGFGLASLRTVSMAIIRDNYSGNRMARIMSFVTSIFIIVPMMAPILGQFLLYFFHWHSIIYFQLGFLLLIILWFGLRLEEKIKDSNFNNIGFKVFSNSLKTFLGYRPVLVYTFIAGLIEGAFIFYLSTVKSIISDHFNYHEGFAYIFGLLSLILGVATFWNGKIVEKFGMLRLLKISLISFCISSLLSLAYLVFEPSTSFVVYAIFLVISFVPMGILFGNVSALALEPLGDIAGFGASFYSFFSMLIGFAFAWLFGQISVESYLAMFICFALSSFLSVTLVFSKYSRSIQI